jgi:hypothetical protein
MITTSWQQTRQRQRQCMTDAGMLSTYPIQCLSSVGVSDAMPIIVPNEVTVLELQSMMRGRANRHRESFAIVLERCYTRIRRCASVRVTGCAFDIPAFVSGMPLYDFQVCKNHVVHHLIRNGFTVTHNGLGGGNALNISWTPSQQFQQSQNQNPSVGGGGWAGFAGDGPRCAPSERAEHTARHAPPATDPADDSTPPRRRSISAFRPTVRFCSNRHL